MELDENEKPVQITTKELAFIIASCIFIGQQSPFTNIKELADGFLTRITKKETK